MVGINYLLDELIDKIKNDKVVSFPTETVYALSCSTYSIEAIERIYKIKERDINKLFSIFVDIRYLDDFVVYNDDLKKFIFDELNGGTTIIFNKKNRDILPNIKSDTLGIRYPKHEFTRTLLNKLDNLPIVATSVNKSGEKPLCEYNDIVNNFNSIDLIIDNNDLINSIISGVPSKILSVAGGDVKIIRK
ncbi:MAG: Sua5/YciO/YrdC/YwlC family protein [Rickettsiales bacterium]|nr:Sua5/YciO/YrdC/YwlC family protein [Rickettsiales bacterium]